MQFFPRDSKFQRFHSRIDIYYHTFQNILVLSLRSKYIDILFDDLRPTYIFTCSHQLVNIQRFFPLYPYHCARALLTLPAATALFPLYPYHCARSLSLRVKPLLPERSYLRPTGACALPYFWPASSYTSPAHHHPFTSPVFILLVLTHTTSFAFLTQALTACR